MSVSAQWASVTPRGMKKKKNLYAPMIEEQAAQGIATRAVIESKEQQRYDEERDLREQEFALQEQQFEEQQAQWQKDYDAQQSQWQADYDARMQQIQEQEAQWNADFAQRRKQDRYSNIIGGLSTAASLLSAFDLF